MNQTKTRNGYVLLSSPNGVKDTRNGRIYSEAEVKAADVKYFVAVE